MLGFIDRLVYADVINLKASWEVVAVTSRQSTQTLWVAAFIAIAWAVVRAGHRKAPRVRNCRVHNHVHWLAWYLRLRNLQAVSIYSEHKPIIGKPLDVTAGSILRRRLPLDTIQMVAVVKRTIEL